MSYELPDLKQIKIIRLKLKIKRQELANAIGVTPNMITQIETDNAKPSYLKAIAIFDYFKKKIGKLPGTVEEICTEKPCTLRPSDKVGTAEKIMANNDWDCIPIADLEGNLKGKVTKMQIDNISKKNNYQEIPIKEIMGESPPTVPYYTPTKWIMRFVTPPDCVLVTKKGNIFGIVDLYDAVERTQGL